MVELLQDRSDMLPRNDARWAEVVMHALLHKTMQRRTRAGAQRTLVRNLRVDAPVDVRCSRQLWLSHNCSAFMWSAMSQLSRSQLPASPVSFVLYIHFIPLGNDHPQCLPVADA